MNHAEFLDRLEAIISKSGLSQNKWCREANIAPSTITLIRAGQWPSAITLIRIATTHCVSLNWLLLGHGQRTMREFQCAS